MNQRELARIAATRVGIRLVPEAYLFIDCIIVEMVEALKRGETVDLRCFGKLSVTRGGPRRMHDVWTRQIRMSEGHVNVNFRSHPGMLRYLKGKTDKIPSRSRVVKALINKERS